MVQLESLEIPGSMQIRLQFFGRRTGTVLAGGEEGSIAEESETVAAVLEARKHLVNLAVGAAIVLTASANADLGHDFGQDGVPLGRAVIALIDRVESTDRGVDATPMLDDQRTHVIVEDNLLDETGAFGLEAVVPFEFDVAHLGDAADIFRRRIIGIVLAQELVVLFIVFEHAIEPRGIHGTVFCQVGRGLDAMLAVLRVAAEVRRDLTQRMQAAVAAEVEHTGRPYDTCYIILVGIQETEQKPVHVVDLEVGGNQDARLGAFVHLRSQRFGRKILLTAAGKKEHSGGEKGDNPFHGRHFLKSRGANSERYRRQQFQTWAPSLSRKERLGIPSFFRSS